MQRDVHFLLPPSIDLNAALGDRDNVILRPSEPPDACLCVSSFLAAAASFSFSFFEPRPNADKPPEKVELELSPGREPLVAEGGGCRGGWFEWAEGLIGTGRDAGA